MDAEIVVLEEDAAEPAAAKKRKHPDSGNFLSDVRLEASELMIKRLTEHVNKLEAENQKYMDEIDRQKEKIAKMKATAAMLKPKKEELNDVDSLNDTIDDYAAKINALEAEKQEFQQKIKDLENEKVAVDQLKAEKQLLINESCQQKTQIAIMEKTIAALQAKIDSLKSVIVNNNAKLNAFEAEKKSQNARIKILEDEIQSMKNVEIQLKNTVENERKMGQEAEILSKAVIMERKNFQATIDQLKAEKQQFSDENGRLKSELLQMKETVISLRAQNKTNETTGTKTQIYLLNSTIDNYAAKIKALEGEKLQLQEKIQKLENENEVERRRYMKERFEQRSKYKKLEDTIKDLNAKNEEAKNQAKRKINSLNSTIRTYATKIKAFEEAQAKTKELDKTAAKISNLKNAVKSRKSPNSASVENPFLAETPHLQPGTKVYAIWRENKYYYPAIIDGYSNGKYTVYYNEDEKIKEENRITVNIPEAQIIPLSLVQESCRVFVSVKNESGKMVPYNGKILILPSSNDGKYEIEIRNKANPAPQARHFKWFEMFFTPSQYREITARNDTASAGQENISDDQPQAGSSTASLAAAINPSSSTPKLVQKQNQKPKKTGKFQTATYNKTSK